MLAYIQNINSAWLIAITLYTYIFKTLLNHQLTKAAI